VVAPYVAVALGVMPLVVASAWDGFRLAWSDPVKSVVAPAEEPLSVRSPGATWAIALTLAWFGLAYWQRRATAWEAALVVLGGAAALARAGNLWLDAAAMLVPLGRQIMLARPSPRTIGAVAAAGALASAVTLATTRPPALPPPALAAAEDAPRQGTVFADWRWAGDLQRAMGPSQQVLAAGGMASEPPDFWLEYVRVVQGHERWADDLQRLSASVVVLDAAGQARQGAALVRTSPDWRVLYDADGALVAQRAPP
jgi:hypothetical protein